MIFETKRLILRPWCAEDAEELYKYAKNPEVGPPAGWPVHTSVENSYKIIKTAFSLPKIYAVCLKEYNKPIGSIGLYHSDIAEKEDEYELGYWIGRPFWGQGLIPEASRKLLRYAFEFLKIQKVWGVYYDGNKKSRKVMDKLGFIYHHTTKGLEVPLLGETRTGHVMLMTRERFMKVELFLKQKQTLGTFLKNGAISNLQYNKSFGDLCDLMEMQNVK